MARASSLRRFGGITPSVRVNTQWCGTQVGVLGNLGSGAGPVLRQSSIVTVPDMLNRTPKASMYFPMTGACNALVGLGPVIFRNGTLASSCIELSVRLRGPS